jgi:hypothetical protein
MKIPITPDCFLYAGNSNPPSGAEFTWSDLVGHDSPGQLGEQAQPEKIRIELPAESEESAHNTDGNLWSHLVAWAEYHRVDLDLALLVCAFAAAHTAGPRLDLTGKGFRKVFVPTLIAATENGGFHRAVSCALDPLRDIQLDLIGRYGEIPARASSGKSKPSDEDLHRDCVREMRRQYDPYHGTPSERLNPEEQSGGFVRFLLEGAPPSNPHRELEGYHLHTALALMDVGMLPQSTRARDKRLEAIASMVNGYRGGKAWIRGFIRIFREDFVSVMEPNRQFMTSSLPVGESEEMGMNAPAREREGKNDFDRIHRTALRGILRLRFDEEEIRADFSDGEAARRFGSLRETYLQEMPSVDHLAPACEVLPDLFAWYLLHLAKSDKACADEMEIAGHAIAAARTLRRKTVRLHDRQVALRIGRKRHALALRLVNRLEHLGGSCTRRDLVRCLDRQRKDVITPVIEVLIHHRVFACEGRGVLMRGSETFDQIGVEAFAPPLEEVPYSGTQRLKIAEQAQAATPG